MDSCGNDFTRTRFQFSRVNTRVVGRVHLPLDEQLPEGVPAPLHHSHPPPVTWGRSPAPALAEPGRRQPPRVAGGTSPRLRCAFPLRLPGFGPFSWAVGRPCGIRYELSFRDFCPFFAESFVFFVLGSENS